MSGIEIVIDVSRISPERKLEVLRILGPIGGCKLVGDGIVTVINHEVDNVDSEEADLLITQIQEAIAKYDVNIDDVINAKDKPIALNEGEVDDDDEWELLNEIDDFDDPPKEV